MIETRGTHHTVFVPFPVPDARTLQAAQAGDTAALNAIATLCAPHVLRWCRRMGGPRVDADDAAQDVLVLVFRRVRAVTSPAALGAWVFGATRRVLADHRRRAWFTRWLPGATAEPTAPARQELDADAARVRAALHALPSSQREAFVLCDIEGYTDLEAAAIADVPLGTLKSRLRLARARLHEHFGPDGP